VAFQLGSDLVGVVDACSRRASDSQGACWRTRHGALSKRIGRAERVARLRNLSADVLIANVAAPIRMRQQAIAAPASTWWLLLANIVTLVAVFHTADRAIVFAARWVVLAAQPCQRDRT
jgi:hypothetical protein